MPPVAVEDEEDSCVNMCEPANDARAIAWLKVFGCGLALGAAVSAACASAGLEACDSSVTLSVIVRDRSPSDSPIFGG